MANLERVQSAVKEAGLDALLLMDDRNIYYATDFMPQDSAALITPDKAFVVTDSRYIEAAEKECAEGVEFVLTTREKPLAATLAELTGKLGDVMKESARAAISYIRSNSTQYGIADSAFDSTDITFMCPKEPLPKTAPARA